MMLKRNTKHLRAIFFEEAFKWPRLAARQEYEQVQELLRENKQAW